MEFWEKIFSLSLHPVELCFVLLWVVCFIGYVVILFQAQKSVGRISQNDLLPTRSSLKVSVLIPARNEEKHLKACLEAILSQNDIHYIEEILVLDDHSTDNTRALVENLHNPLIRCISLPASLTGKKAAITLGVKLAKASVIALTDADCIPEKNWIRSVSKQYVDQNALIFTTGLVSIQDHQNVLSRFQSLDFMANMALTAWGLKNQYFYLANGANMSFLKTSFEDVGGYGGNEHIASGDDVFLIKKMAEQKNKTLMFLHDPDAAVVTTPQKTWATLWEQRKRWATKSKAYASGTLWSVQALTFLLSVGIIGFILYSLIFSAGMLYISMLILLIKAVVDYLFLSGLSKKWNLHPALQYYPLSFLTYLIYIIFMGLTALFPSAYLWKGRKQQ